MSEVLFYLFAAVAIASAVLCITRRNAVAAACWMVLMFFGLAGTFVVLGAFFVAAIQILVYAGAIMVLFLFVIMLIDLRSDELAVMAAPRFKPLGLLAAAGFLALTVWAVTSSGTGFEERVPGQPEGSAAAIGEVLFNRWLLAFEVTSLLLLGAILGAVVLTKRRLT